VSGFEEEGVALGNDDGLVDSLIHFHPGDPRLLRALVCLFLLSSVSFAQEVSGVLRKGSSEWGVFVVGGTGFGKRSSTQNIGVGGRWGKVWTNDIGNGWYRGNFETKIEIIPFQAYLQPPVNAYGVEVKPGALIWNFTGNRRVKPFFELSGGLLITNHDVPVNTNHVNFTPQGGMGFHVFTGRNRAWTFQGMYKHVSNAGLDRRNSGINASLQFVLGYTWFK
jgi:lipid A 3-O-deacylase